jgi:DUF4097 and DUF4098 domain-containing protein YvlB
MKVKVFEMRLKSLQIGVLLALLTVAGSSAFAQSSRSSGQGVGKGQGVGQSTRTAQSAAQSDETVATETVNVTLAIKRGRIQVRGWEQRQVRAQASGQGTRVELRRRSVDANPSSPATHVEVLVYGSSRHEPDDGANNTGSSVTLDVPRGAILYVKTHDGDVEVDGVAEAHVATIGGKIIARHISRATDASSVGGDVTLEDSSGRAVLHSVGGVIEARDIRAVNGSDSLKIKSISGDVILDRIGPARIEASAISGEVKLLGPLARGGIYSFTTTTGDVTLMLPVDSSFKVNAKVSESGEIVTEFPLKYTGDVSSFELLKAGRLVGTYGTGDATINMISFSGTLRLRKKP